MTAGVTPRPVRPELRVAMADGVDTVAWRDLRPTGNGSFFSPQAPRSAATMVHRMRQAELRGAIRERAAVREQWIGAGEDPADLIVALEIDVLIAADARTARRELLQYGEAQFGDTVRYVGTPQGLATLILDVYVADVADAAILCPIISSAGSKQGTAALIIDDVLPLLGDKYPWRS